MITEEDIFDHLEHFGIKGQRWGVRKSPAQLKAHREGKAQKYVDKAADAQKQIDFYKSRPARFGQKRGERFKVKDLEKIKTQAIKDAQSKREGKLSKKQKQVAVGAGVAVALLAAYGASHSLNSGNARRLMEKGKAFATRKAFSWKKNDSLADPKMGVNAIKELVVKPINPNYGAAGTKMNCRRATYAYEMRRRGYDVAATRTTNGIGQDIGGAYNALHPGANLVPSGQVGIAKRLFTERNRYDKPITEGLKNQLGKISVEPENIFNELSKLPNGARGELGMTWIGGGGHSMAWEIVKGKPVLIDNQIGEIFSSPAQITKLTSSMWSSGITRLDDAPLNNDFLLKWLRNA